MKLDTQVLPTRFRLLVFDWDGTLMDSELQIVTCMHAALADLDEVPLSDDAVRNIIGLGLREAIEALVPGRGPQFQENLVERYRHHWLNGGHRSEMFAGAAATLQNLHSAGYLLAVATGKGRTGLDKVLRETGLAGLFQSTRCSDETQSKPHPRMLQEIMLELGVTSQETLMIGDTEYDLEMATNARATAVGVSYGVHSSERLLRHQPLGLLHDIRELPVWLESIGLNGTAVDA